MANESTIASRSLLPTYESLYGDEGKFPVDPDTVARLRAEAENATPEQIREATAFGSLVGITEALAPAKVLGRIRRTKKGVTAVNKAVDRISSAAITGGIEGAQEAAAGIAQNFIAQGIYKPEQELVEGLGENFTVGNTTGYAAPFSCLLYMCLYLTLHIHM